MRKYFTFNLILAATLVTGCLPSKAGSTPTMPAKTIVDTSNWIYFSYAKDEANEIWQMKVDGSGGKLLYQIPRRLTLLSAEQNGFLSKEAAQFLRQFIASGSIIGIQDPDAIPLEGIVSSLSLSPSKKFLAWLEAFQWCPGNYCIGQDTIKVLRIEDGEIIFSINTPESLSEPRWSPNSRCIAFGETERLAYKETEIKLLDIDTGSVSNIGKGFPSSWAKESNRLLAVIQAQDSLQVGLGSFSINNGMRTILSPTWEYIAGPQWLPNDIRIGFIGKVDPNSDTQIYSLIEHNMDTQILPTGLNYFGELQWASNGKWIALKTGFSFTDLVILNASDGSLFRQIGGPGKIIGDWQWSDDGSKIAYVSLDESGDPHTEQIHIFNMSEDNDITLHFPNSIITFLQVYKFFDIGGISVTW